MRRLVLALPLLALTLTGVSCTDEPSDDADAPTTQVGSPPDVVLGPTDLPFGLRHVDGTAPVGRPLLFDHVAFTYDDEPVESRYFSVAFTVSSNDPEAVFRDWLDQLGALEVAEVSVWRDSGPLLTASGMPAGGRPVGDSFNLELWSTEAGPVVLVDVARYGGDVPGDPVVDDRTEEPASGPSTRVRDLEPGPGDVLFTEQGDAILVPQGTRALMPVLPIWGGTGGSMSVLASVDGPATVRDLLDQARAYGADNGEVTEPVETEVDGAHVVDAAFGIPAGGWGFGVTSIQGPDDPYATVYVRSWAD